MSANIKQFPRRAPQESPGGGITSVAWGELVKANDNTCVIICDETSEPMVDVDINPGDLLVVQRDLLPRRGEAIILTNKCGDQTITRFDFGDPRDGEIYGTISFVIRAKRVAHAEAMQAVKGELIQFPARKKRERKTSSERMVSR